MKHRYDIEKMLVSILGYKGLPYPGGFLPKRPVGDYIRSDWPPDDPAWVPVRKEFVKGTRLYKRDALGRWYFMPVSVCHPSLPGLNHTLELPHAVISLDQRKRIVETDMVNRRGSVKELISVGDYEISVAAFLQSSDGTYPEAEIASIHNLFSMNESVELISALTDLLFDKDDQVVITQISWPATPGVEDGQAVTFKCRTDVPFELIIQEPDVRTEQ